MELISLGHNVIYHQDNLCYRLCVTTWGHHALSSDLYKTKLKETGRELFQILKYLLIPFSVGRGQVGRCIRFTEHYHSDKKIPEIMIISIFTLSF